MILVTIIIICLLHSSPTSLTKDMNKGCRQTLRNSLLRYCVRLSIILILVESSSLKIPGGLAFKIRPRRSQSDTKDKEILAPESAAAPEITTQEKTTEGTEATTNNESWKETGKKVLLIFLIACIVVGCCVGLFSIGHYIKTPAKPVEKVAVEAGKPALKPTVLDVKKKLPEKKGAKQSNKERVTLSPKRPMTSQSQINISTQGIQTISGVSFVPGQIETKTAGVLDQKKGPSRGVQVLKTSPIATVQTRKKTQGVPSPKIGPISSRQSMITKPTSPVSQGAKPTSVVSHQVVMKVRGDATSKLALPVADLLSQLTKSLTDARTQPTKPTRNEPAKITRSLTDARRPTQNTKPTGNVPLQSTKLISRSPSRVNLPSKILAANPEPAQITRSLTNAYKPTQNTKPTGNVPLQSAKLISRSPSRVNLPSKILAANPEPAQITRSLTNAPKPTHNTKPTRNVGLPPQDTKLISRSPSRMNVLSKI